MAFDFNKIDLNKTEDFLDIPKLKVVSPVKAIRQKYNIVLPKTYLFNGHDMFGNMCTGVKLPGNYQNWCKILEHAGWVKVNAKIMLDSRYFTTAAEEHIRMVWGNLVYEKVINIIPPKPIYEVYRTEDDGIYILITPAPEVSGSKYMGILIYSGAKKYPDLAVTPEEIADYFEINKIDEGFDFDSIDLGNEDVIDSVQAVATGQSAYKNIEVIKEAGLLSSKELESLLRYVCNFDTDRVQLKPYQVPYFDSTEYRKYEKQFNEEFPELLFWKCSVFTDTNGERVDKLFSWNSWSDITKDVLNNNSLELTHPRFAQLKNITDNAEIVTDTPERLMNMKQVWLSPDEGVYGIVISRVPFEGKVINYIMFIYTGFVAYNKIKKVGSQYSREHAVYQFMRRVLYHTGVGGESIITSKGWSYIPDKNGYPRAMTVLYTPLHLYKRCPRTWYAKCEDVVNNWSKKIPSQNPSVLMRRNSNNGMVEMGCFLPWPIEKLYGNREWMLYRKDAIGLSKDNEELYKENPQEFGVFVYQLSTKGKQMFDEFVSMKYNMSKWGDLWAKYTGQAEDKNVIFL